MHITKYSLKYGYNKVERHTSTVANIKVYILRSMLTSNYTPEYTSEYTNLKVHTNFMFLCLHVIMSVCICNYILYVFIKGLSCIYTHTYNYTYTYMLINLSLHFFTFLTKKSLSMADCAESILHFLNPPHQAAFLIISTLASNGHPR